MIAFMIAFHEVEYTYTVIHYNYLYILVSYALSTFVNDVVSF